MAYDHMKAGPTLVQGANLGGLNFTGTMWLTRKWGVATSERAYVGTSGTGNSTGPSGGSAQSNIKGPFISSISSPADRNGWGRTTNTAI